ncbi:hypothetical protein DXG01_014816 [Tephrocybe rancida]|nr:hypothetical protein DXG01_014816 [Tephrocybe rancida]
MSSGAISSVTSNLPGILALTKDIALLFANVPYIQGVASIVERIIQIADDVKVNKDRAHELIDKIMVYAGVIFDALSGSQLRTEDSLSDLKSDLLHIASVLESIYNMLESLGRDSTLSARINRVLQRQELFDRLAMQDRRLDTLITSFQLKSSIVLRAKPDQIITRERVSIEAQELPPNVQSTRLRSKPRVFGRDGEINEIVDLIQQPSPARVAILGSGGIGKTTLALSVLHDQRIIARFQQRRLFVSCEAARSADHIVFDLMTALQIPLNGNSGNPVDFLLDCLSKAPHLVVLDNLETPWELPVARAEVETLLRDLADIETVTLVVTIRGSQRPSSVEWSQLFPPLQPVEPDAALDMFKAICHKTDDFAVKLIKSVDCVPLAVTLLGNLAAVDGETTEALWRRWHAESVTMVENGDDRLSNLEISIEISLSSPRVRRDPDALRLLRLLSLLPDAITSEALHAFERGIPGIAHVGKGLSTLIQNALVTRDTSGSVRILSPIRLHMCARHAPSMESHRFLQDYYLGMADEATALDDFSVQNRFRAEYGNIEAMLLDCLEVPFGRQLEEIVETILGFCQEAYLCGIGSTHVVSLAADKLVSHTSLSGQVVKTVSKPRRNIVSRLFMKGSPIVTRDDQNVQPVDKAVKLRGDCLGCLGQLLSRQARLKEAEASFEQAIKLHIQAGDVSGHAYDLNNMGCLLSRHSATTERAESIFAEAHVLHEQIGDGVGAAYDLMGLGQLLLQQNKFTAAKGMLSQALTLFTEHDDKIGRCATLNSLGHAVLSCAKPSDAQHYFLLALDLSSGRGDVVGHADSLAGMACTLLLQANFPEAKQSVEKAISLRSPTENPEYLHLLGRINVALYDFEEATKLFTRAQTLHQQMLDERGYEEDSRYLLQIDFYQGRLLKDSSSSPEYIAFSLSQRLQEYSLGHRDLDTRALIATIRLHTFDIVGGERRLTRFMTNNEAEGTLGLGFYHHQIGCFYLRRELYDKAESNFREALKFHEEAENVQGQADDHNKLSEIYLRRGLFREALSGISSQALRLHTKIGDIGGQGDDLYVQACVYLQQGRLEEAEETVRQALEFHTRSSMLYGQGLDQATLSSVLWQKYLAFDNRGASEAVIARSEALHALEDAADVFSRFVATSELLQCQSRYTKLKKEFGLKSNSQALLITVHDYDNDDDDYDMDCD